MMANPWTKKNPLMSMWLSAANATAGAARGRMTAAARRTATQAATTGLTEYIKLMTTVPAAKPPPRAKKKRR